MSPSEKTHSISVRRRRRWLRPILLGLLLTPVVMALAFAALPLPRNLDGATFCWPLIGPVTEIDSALTGVDREKVEAHERVHAEQCRRMGAVRNFLVRLTGRQRLPYEVEAICAEVVLDLARGVSRAQLEQRIVDELSESMWYRRLGPVALREGVRRGCPPLTRPSG